MSVAYNLSIVFESSIASKVSISKNTYGFPYPIPHLNTITKITLTARARFGCDRYRR